MTRESFDCFAGFFMELSLPFKIKYLGFSALPIFGELKVANMHPQFAHVMVVLTIR